MAWGFGSGNGNAASLTPPGVGSGVSKEQMAMFASAAQSSGLSDMAVNKVDQITNGLPGMKNEDQVQMLYQLMAIHPNEVSLFFLEHPSFMTEFAALIGLIVRRELYAWFSSGVMNATLNAEAAAQKGYSTITDENIQAQVQKTVPLQSMQQAVSNADMQAMQMMNNNQMMAQQQQMQQMQMAQQPMYPQQGMMQPGMYPQQGMMQPGMAPQRPGVASALGNFGSTLIRGSLGLPPAQQQTAYQQPMPPQM